MKKIVLLMMVIILMLSCQKSNPGATTPPSNNNPISTTGNVLSKNTSIVDTLAISSVTENSITVLKNKTSLRPKTGDILLAAPSLSYPYGFLRKVLSITENSSQITYITEQSNLNDAFSQLYINTIFTDTFSSSYLAGRAQAGPKLSIKFQDNTALGNGIKLNGELVFNFPTVTMEYIKKVGSLSPEKVLIQADFTIEGSTFEITNDENSAIQVGEKIITDFELPILRVPVPVPTPVGVIIIPIPFSQNLVVKTLPLSISGKAKWKILPGITASLGAKYENSTWSNLSTYKIEAKGLPLTRSDFFQGFSLSANVKFITPEYDITPYKIDALKAFFSIPNTLDLSIKPFTSPNYSLKYSLDVKGGVKQEFYTGAKGEFSISGNVITEKILEGNWQKPLLNTTAATDITYNSATSGGEITDDGGAPIIARGVCYNTSPNPTIANSKTTDGSGKGVFTSQISGLLPLTKYYSRAYAMNSGDTAYGNEISFSTKEESSDSTFTDPRDGQVYPIKRIGTQVWMTKNLNFSAGGSFCYNNSSTNCGTYGRLYNWNIAKSVAPLGWHLPSNAEWAVLINFLGGESVAGSKMKSSSDFAGLFGGILVINPSSGVSEFLFMGDEGAWWSTTPNGGKEAWIYGIMKNQANVGKASNDKTYSFSVRCIKD